MAAITENIFLESCKIKMLLSNEITKVNFGNVHVNINVKSKQVMFRCVLSS